MSASILLCLVILLGACGNKSLSFSQKPAASPTPSFCGDGNQFGNISYQAHIEPLLTKYCAGCHAADSVSTHLLDYEIVRRKVDVIYGMMKSKAMPPEGYQNIPNETETELVIQWKNESNCLRYQNN